MLAAQSWWHGNEVVVLESVEVLLRFSDPTSAKNWTDAREILEQMEELPRPADHPRSLTKAKISESVDQAMNSLFQSLVHDHEANQRRIKPPMSWHYEVVRSHEHPHCLGVHTVLTTPGRRGGTRYGAQVRRLSDNEYALWIND